MTSRAVRPDGSRPSAKPHGRPSDAIGTGILNSHRTGPIRHGRFGPTGARPTKPAAETAYATPRDPLGYDAWEPK